MADPRPYRTLLEQPRHRLWLALIAVALALAVGTGLLLRGGPEPVVSPAYAIPFPKSRLMVEVLNGTRRQGVARTATRMLRRNGVDVVFLGNADSAEDTTRVIVRRGDPTRARIVAEVLGAGRLVVEADTFRRVDVSVILGDDFKPRPDMHP